MGYVYKRTETELWTVGFHTPDGKWEPESDHGSKEEAAERAAWLNGSDAPPDEVGRLRRQLAELREQYDAEVEWQNAWLGDVTAILEAALNCREHHYDAASVAALDAAITAAPYLDPRADEA